MRTALLFCLLLLLRWAYYVSTRLPIDFGSIEVQFEIAIACLCAAVLLDLRYRWHALSLVARALALYVLGCLGSGFIATACFYTGRALPFVDAYLLTADKALGFDWVGYLRFVDRHAWLNALLYPAYQSIALQPVLMIAVLALKHDARRVYTVLTVMIIGLMLCSAVAIFAPALGSYQYLGVSPADHPHIVIDNMARMTAPILWLRAATFDTPFPDPVGLITFPSFHAFSAVLYIWGWWRMPLFRWVGLALNLVMLLATPLHGSHYLVDLIAGAGMAAALIAIVLRLLMERRAHPRWPAPHGDRQDDAWSKEQSSYA